MARRTLLLVALALAASGCANNRQDPYRDSKSNPAGTPADRTGGAASKPDNAGAKR